MLIFSLWVINSAPFFPGLFAWIGGIKQDRVKAANEFLTAEVDKRSVVEKLLHIQNEFMNDDPEYARLIQHSCFSENSSAEIIEHRLPFFMGRNELFVMLKGTYGKDLISTKKKS